MQVGTELAHARRELGLSLDEVSARTKISVDRLTAIEEMDAQRLPSLVYLKGFLRAYAAEVGLGPDDIAERYVAEMDVVGPLDLQPRDELASDTLGEYADESGSDPGPGPSDSVVLPTTPAVPAAEPVVHATDPLVAAPLGDSDRDLDEPPSAPGPTRLDDDEPAPVRTDSAPPYFAADEVPVIEPERPRRSSKRTAALILALPLSVLAGWVVGENYDKITGRSIGTTVANDGNVDDASPPAASQAEPDAAAASADAARTPAADPEREPEGTPPEPAARVEEPVERAEAREPASRPEPASAPASSSSNEPPSRPAARSIERARPASPAPAPEPDPRVVRSGDLSGRWTLTSRIEESSYRPYKGMNVGFQLQLRQDGNRVTGAGQKWMENGRALPPRARTPIAVEGTIDGGRLTLNFTERGTRRTSAGTFTLDVTDNSTLSGTFASDAANAQGTSLARRVQQ